MAVNINPNINIAGQITPQSPSVVTDAELTKVAKEILTASPSGTLSRANNRSNLDINLFNAGNNVNTSRQIANNKTGFQLNFSQNAINDLNSLKAQAAQIQAKNLSKVVDGKIHVNAEKPESAEFKSLFTATAAELEVFQSKNLDRDKKGSGGFYMPLENNEEEVNDVKEGLNLVI